MLQQLYSVGVSAGVEIKNVAYLDYMVEDVDFSAKSNTLIDIVDQKIDMQVLCQESSSIVVGTGEKRRALRFLLTNRGNAKDSYTFSSIEGEKVDFSVNNAEVYLDNGDGVFSVEDSLATELTVLADGNVTLFLVSDIPIDADKTSSNGIEAHSQVQGSLLYGESKFLENFYALVATPESANSYEVSNLALLLEKTATLSSEKVYMGTTIEYKIDVKVVGKGTVKNVVIKDDIPTGTTYVAESLKLDGISAGDFNGTSISVSLASITQNIENSDSVHQVTFDVKVQ